MNRQRLGTAVVAAVVLVAGLVGGGGPASYGVVAGSTGSATTAPSFQITITQTAQANAIAAGTLACNVTIDNPHYSSGAPGVISKLRYTCSGTMSGTLGVNLNLYKYAPGTVGPYVPKASNNVSRPVSPLAVGTVYVPASNLPGISCNGNHWYYASAFLTLSAGPSSDTGYATSSTVHPNCP